MFKRIVKPVFFGLILVAVIAFNSAMAILTNPKYFGLSQTQAESTAHTLMLVYTASLVIAIIAFAGCMYKK